MRKQFLLLLAVLVGTAAAVIVVAIQTYGVAVSDVEGLVAFIAVGTIAQLAAIDFGSGTPARSSMAFVPFITGTLVFTPPVAILNAVVVVAIPALLLEKPRWTVAVFNLCQTSISVGGAALAYSLMAPPVSPLGIRPLGLAAGVAVFFCGNMVMNSAGIATLSGVPWLPALRQMVGPMGANLWYDFLASPFAIVTAILYWDYHVLGILIIILPMLLLRHSYSSRLDLEQAIKALLDVLVKAIETRDPYTSGHSIRVASLSRAIASDLGLPQRQIDRIEMAALLHDVGKIDVVYEPLIRKPHSLTDDERELIRTHAAKGADLLESLGSLPAEVVKAVRHHHERYDGLGYPRGLTGDEIPLSARIIMICDSIDAMLSDRPYRKALPVNTVLRELKSGRGTQFDPDVVDTILAHGTLKRAAMANIGSGAPLELAPELFVATS